MMNAIRSALSFFKPAPYKRRALKLCPVNITPERSGIRDELEKAKEANAKAGMGVVLTAARAARDESRIQAMYRGMLDEMDKGKKHNE